MALNFVCMYCGKDALDAMETEYNVYNEYPELGNVEMIMWVYCKPCDTWTQHPLVD